MDGIGKVVDDDIYAAVFHFCRKATANSMICPHPEPSTTTSELVTSDKYYKDTFIKNKKKNNNNYKKKTYTKRGCDMIHQI